MAGSRCWIISYWRCKRASGKSKFITSEIRKAMRIRNTLKRKFYKSRSTDDWDAYRSQRNRVVSMRRKSIVNHFNQLCDLRAGNPREFWKSLQPLMHTSKRAPEEFIVLKEKEKIIKEQNQVAEIFHEYYTNITKDIIVQEHTTFEDQSHVSAIPVANEGPEDKFGFSLTNHHVVKVVLDDVKPNKAQGYDSIPPRAIKASSSSIAEPLCDLINTIISRSHVPDTWKHGQIIPHHKKDSVLEKANFRPVTVLPAFAKVFERIIHMQMTEHFEGIFHDFMFAYRKFHGCAAALLTLTEHWREELDKRKVIAAVATDLSKAFDCLPHDLILEKLKFYGMNDNSVSLLQSYLSSRYQRVKLGQTFSTWMGVSAGVPQRSLLGPLLFNIFMNDLVFAIKNCRLINYADDSKLYLSHQDPLVVQDGINQDLANTIQWFQQNGMIANPEKYQAVVLGNTAHDFEIKCSEELIPISNEIKLLGVTLDNKLKFDSHIRSICRKVGGQVNALNRLKNILPCKTKEALYRAFILPHFHYCSQIWHHCGARNTNKLEKVNERALRYVYKDKTTPYDKLLKWAGLSSSLKDRRIQDMLITVNSCFQGRAPASISNLINVRKSKYHLRGTNMLSLPKVNSTKHGLRSFRYFASKNWNAMPDAVRAMVGTKEFINKVRHMKF